MQKVGILGGTFNPIHIGHLILAECAYDQFNLEKVLIMPTKNPPHKSKDEIIQDNHRCKMINLSIKNNSHLELSTFELEREGTTYTANTLISLKYRNPNIKYYFIVGADSLFYIDKWYKPDVILRNCILLVATRYGLSNKGIEEKIFYLENKFDANIKILNIPTIGISSNELRESINHGNTIKYFVNDDVEQYILKNNLYKNKV